MSKHFGRVVVFGGTGFIGRHLVDGLLDCSNEVVLFDLLEPINTHQNVQFFKGNLLDAEAVEAAVEGADAVVLLTEWSQYKSLDWQDLSRRMRRPAWVFDSRTIVNPDQVRSAGLRLWCVGNGSL